MRLAVASQHRSWSGLRRRCERGSWCVTVSPALEAPTGRFRYRRHRNRGQVVGLDNHRREYEAVADSQIRIIPLPNPSCAPDGNDYHPVNYHFALASLDKPRLDTSEARK